MVRTQPGLPLTSLVALHLLASPMAGGAQSQATARPAAASVQTTSSEVIRVGPQRRLTSLAAAARLATDGAVVEVDAGTYRGDVATWTQRDLVLRAVGGRVRLLADGEAAEGKGIWVVRSSGTVTVEGFDFEGATVASGNGAGIRLDRGRLAVRDCSFLHNETGILTSNDPQSELEVEGSEFAYNLRPDGQSHHLYAGAIARLTVSGSYFHHAEIGHLLKSRAAFSLVRYNRLTDETGRASYELEFPNGGIAVVVGNLIQQSAQTDNPVLVSFGAEGYPRLLNELYLTHNTLVNEAPHGGPFVQVRPGAVSVHAVDNVYAGNGAFTNAAQVELSRNFHAGADDFVAAGAYDYRLRPTSALRRHAVDAGHAGTLSLVPTRQYRHPRRTVPLHRPPADPGALQGA